MEKTKPEECKHKKWLYITNSKGDMNGISECIECGLWLTHAERLSLESLKNQKNVSFVSVVLSIIAIVVSVVALYTSNPR